MNLVTLHCEEAKLFLPTTHHGYTTTSEGHGREHIGELKPCFAPVLAPYQISALREVVYLERDMQRVLYVNIDERPHTYITQINALWDDLGLSGGRWTQRQLGFASDHHVVNASQYGANQLSDTSHELTYQSYCVPMFLYPGEGFYPVAETHHLPGHTMVSYALNILLLD